MSRLLLFLICVTALPTFAQRPDTLFLIHNQKPRQLFFVKGDPIRCIYNEDGTQSVKGVITAIGVDSIQIDETRVSLENIRTIYPTDRQSKRWRAVGATTLLLGSVGSSALAGNEPAYFAIPATVAIAGGYLLGRAQFDCESRWSMEISNQRIAYVPPPENTTIAKERHPLLEKRPVPSWFLKTSVIQNIDKEFNVALEHRLVGPHHLEYAVGVLHETRFGKIFHRSSLAGEYLYLPLTAHAEGATIRATYKRYWESKTRLLEPYTSFGLKYRHQLTDSRLYNTRNCGDQTNYSYTHQNDELQVQANVGLLFPGKRFLHHELLWGFGLSFQNLNTTYECINCNEFSLPKPGDSRFDRDNGFYVLPRMQVAYLIGIGW